MPRGPDAWRLGRGISEGLYCGWPRTPSASRVHVWQPCAAGSARCVPRRPVACVVPGIKVMLLLGMYEGARPSGSGLGLGSDRAGCWAGVRFLGAEGALVSCSADRTVKLWSADVNGAFTAAAVFQARRRLGPPHAS